MNLAPRKVLAAAAAAVALVAGQAAVTTAAAAPAQKSPLQQRIDSYVAEHPESRQIGTDKVKIPGGTLTVPAPGSTPPSTNAISCGSGWLCIQDGRGYRYDYYTCGYYSFSGIGDGVFNNNQTSGTRARFYNSDGSERWSHVAKGSGTASWTPVFGVRPC
ncbi:MULTISPECIES: hypothetical protein [unclassified Streptomyces]|uniref:hypothetical protein n=1 Tax=unclassified Streptomyces TaxID=2593676 RepID=UPI0004C6C893|nr:hypothetical protein [Streptomyces sp. NRRL F-5135]